MATSDPAPDKSTSKSSGYSYSITHGYSVSDYSSTLGSTTSYGECVSQGETHSAAAPLHLHDGFVSDGAGLTYIGPLQDFPERFLRQALCGLEMSRGRAGLITFLEDYVAVLKLKRGRK